MTKAGLDLFSTIRYSRPLFAGTDVFIGSGTSMKTIGIWGYWPGVMDSLFCTLWKQSRIVTVKRFYSIARGKLRGKATNRGPGARIP